MHVCECIQIKTCICLHVSPCEFGAYLLPRLQPFLICLHGQDVFLLQLSF